MKKLVSIAKNAGVNALACCGAAVLLSACGAGMTDAGARPGTAAYMAASGGLGTMTTNAVGGMASKATDANAPADPGAPSSPDMPVDAADMPVQASTNGEAAIPAQPGGAAEAGIPAQPNAPADAGSATPATTPAYAAPPAQANTLADAGTQATGPAAAQGGNSFAMVGYGAGAMAQQAGANGPAEPGTPAAATVAGASQP